jgi:2-keto-4-pentenoate hydratase/2-oxohepta-3-ene-1,7-dioic acid hydratase in catechol pathway
MRRGRGVPPGGTRARSIRSPHERHAINDTLATRPEDMMKLLRFGAPGQEKPGILDADGRIRDLSGVIPDVAGEALRPTSLQRLHALDVKQLPVVDGEPRLGPCVGRVGKFICIGLNYADHAAESGAAVPREPVVFMKATSSIIGPNDDVVIPRGSEKTDWEVELGVIIGSPTKYVAETDALAHVAGYCVVNDLSERAFQLEGTGQWVKGKSADTFGPIGPWLVTTDEVPDPQALHLWLEVNRHRYQDGSTSTMVFGVAHLVSFLSRFMSLQPGDVITTGTPPGVGMGQKPQRYLRAGDQMALGIEGLGRQHQRVVADPGA